MQPSSLESVKAELCTFRDGPSVTHREVAKCHHTDIGQRGEPQGIPYFSFCQLWPWCLPVCSAPPGHPALMSCTMKAWEQVSFPRAQKTGLLCVYTLMLLVQPSICARNSDSELHPYLALWNWEEEGLFHQKQFCVSVLGCGACLSWALKCE